MQAAAMQQAPGQPMPGQPMPGQPMPGQQQMPMPGESLTLKTEEYEADARSAKFGEENRQQGPEAWEAGLEPKEREVLMNSVREKFPLGYERLLSLYYRNLAATREGQDQ